ncbi:unnamed protein product, partial [Urochloa humidicola]
SFRAQAAEAEGEPVAGLTLPSRATGGPALLRGDGAVGDPAQQLGAGCTSACRLESSVQAGFHPPGRGARASAVVTCGNHCTEYTQVASHT